STGSYSGNALTAPIGRVVPVQRSGPSRTFPARRLGIILADRSDDVEGFQPVMSSNTRIDAAAAAWPELTLSAWEDTRDTFHMWAQVVGKIRLALEPMVNHWWQVPLYVSARGLTTSLMHAGTTGLEIEFDLIDHVLDIRTSDGRGMQVTLE